MEGTARALFKSWFTDFELSPPVSVGPTFAGITGDQVPTPSTAARGSVDRWGVREGAAAEVRRGATAALNRSENWALSPETR